MVHRIIKRYMGNFTIKVTPRHERSLKNHWGLKKSTGLKIRANISHNAACHSMCRFQNHDRHMDKAENLKNMVEVEGTYTHTSHFIRNTCKAARLCSYPIRQSRGSRTMHNILQIQVKSVDERSHQTSEWSKVDLCGSTCDMIAGASSQRGGLNIWIYFNILISWDFHTQWYHRTLIVACLLCQTGCFEYFRNCRSRGIFTHNSVYNLYRMAWRRRKKKNITYAEGLQADQVSWPEVWRNV